ncbi:DUF805 domain-containing protein [Liquorilactobacillus aquaticus]|nr:DUF805 domain-containing protein [Liquorilactobacillus aquaticus]
MITAYKEFWRNILTWNATATRSQYWWPIIINYILGSIIAGILENLMGHPVEEIYSVGDLSTNLVAKFIIFLVWLATLTLKARRLHDTDRSAGWIFITLVPIIGQIWLLVLFLLPSANNSRWTTNQSEIQ